MIESIAKYGTTITIVYTGTVPGVEKFSELFVPHFREIVLEKIGEEGEYFFNTDILLFYDLNDSMQIYGKMLWHTVFVPEYNEHLRGLYNMYYYTSDEIKRISDHPESRVFDFQPEIDDLKQCFLNLVDTHFSDFKFEPDDIFWNSILPIRCGPCDPYHIIAADVAKIVEYINSRYQGEKIILWSSDERLDYFIIYKAQVIVDLLQHNLGEVDVYLFSDDLLAEEVYAKACENRNILKKIKMLSGLNNTFLMAKTYLSHEYTKIFQVPTHKFLMYSGGRLSGVRISALGFLLQNNLLGEGLVSFSQLQGYEYVSDDIDDSDTVYRDINISYLNTVKQNSDMLPLRLDDPKDSVLSASLSDDNFNHHEAVRFSVVQETIFHNSSAPANYMIQTSTEVTHAGGFAFTEKTIKEFVFNKPFLLFANSGALAKLRELGFKTFSPFLDESYDEIQHDGERMLALNNEILRLCSLNDKEWDSIDMQLQEVYQHNRKHLTQPGNIFTKPTEIHIKNMIKDILGYTNGF